MNRAYMEKEAVRRLSILGVMKEVKEAFKEGKIYYSERFNKQFPATLYYLDENKEYKKMVEEFEKKTGYVVYHVIKTSTTFGEILDFIFVSKYKEDWEYEFEENNGNFIVMSMANNLSDENMSDMGSIVVRETMGGLERIG